MKKLSKRFQNAEIQAFGEVICSCSCSCASCNGTTVSTSNKANLKNELVSNTSFTTINGVNQSI